MARADRLPEPGHFDDPDLELLRRVRHGDERAFHELMDRYADALYALAFSLVGNAADAEDILQETFAGAFRHAASFEERSTVKTWLTRILVRQTARHHRRKGRWRFLPLHELSQGAQALLGGAGVPPGEAADLRMDVLNMLDTLSAEHRQVLVLRELEGMSYEDIAESLDVPRGTVESRLFRARQGLRERLKDYLT